MEGLANLTEVCAKLRRSKGIWQCMCCRVLLKKVNHMERAPGCLNRLIDVTKPCTSFLQCKSDSNQSLIERRDLYGGKSSAETQDERL